MAAYTATSNENSIALPAHFDQGEFTSGATDNWDHESGNVSEHETVSALYQDKPKSEWCKPRISDTGVLHGFQAFREVLPCQVQKEFYKPARRSDIRDSFIVEDQIYSSDIASISHVTDTAWSICRLDIGDASRSSEVGNIVYPSPQHMPAWSASNAVWTRETVPVKHVVLPYPITKYNTVYTPMKNFVSICSQLVQDKMPIYMDEEVYYIAKEIQLLGPGEFSSRFLCLGTFHNVKNLLKCIGKSLAGSGTESV